MKLIEMRTEAIIHRDRWVEKITQKQILLQLGFISNDIVWIMTIQAQIRRVLE
jgi:hypothetical protein